MQLFFLPILLILVIDLKRERERGEYSAEQQPMARPRYRKIRRAIEVNNNSTICEVQILVNCTQRQEGNGKQSMRKNTQ